MVLRSGKVYTRPLRRALVPLALALSVVALPASAARVVQVDIDHVVHPLTAELVAAAVDQAESSGADAVLVRLNTPGGLLSATEEIVQTIVGSPVPVITFVAPSGGKAASAGFFILIAADVAAMAPSANTGAAHPVMMGGGEIDEVMKQKIENDAAAKIRSIADQRGRNVELAEAAVIESRSFTEQEALEQNLIDLVAKDVPDLLAQLDGRAVVRFDGEEITLSLKDAVVEPVETTMRQRMLLPLVDPSLAMILLVLGALGIYIEFTHPGLILPGVAGSLMAILGLMALSVLPINWAGAALIILGLACLTMEAFVVSHGVLAGGGVVAMTLGIVMLVDTDVPELSIGWGVALAITLPFAAITVFLLQLAVRSFRYKVATGSDALIGEFAKAKTSIDPEGQVFLHGEFWSAYASSPIAEGASVRITAVDGLKLTVESAEPQ